MCDIAVTWGIICDRSTVCGMMTIILCDTVILCDISIILAVTSQPPPQTPLSLSALQRHL